MRAVASKPGAELSSTAPEITPAKVIGFAESLHSLLRPRQTRMNDMSRVTIWILRMVPVFWGFSVVHTLVSPANRVGKFSGPSFYVLEALLAIELWFLLPLHFKKEPRIALLVDGGIATGKSLPVPRLRQGVEVAFEFCDAGRKSRTRSALQPHGRPTGGHLHADPLRRTKSLKLRPRLRPQLRIGSARIDGCDSPSWAV